MAYSMDELLQQMEADELEDRLVVQTKATPVEYGKLRGIAPQRVYYYLRTKRLSRSTCDCGRKVIDIQEADELFKKGKFDGTQRGSFEELGSSEEHEDDQP